MLNDLVNSTGPYCSSYNKIIDSCVCDDIAELFECYNEVKSQSDENSCALQKLSTYINCDNGNIEANNISASSASINGILSCGINADSITANSVCAKNKLETECVEAENITADSLNVSDISASNLTGLSSLTVEGQATVDKLQADEIETAGKVTASSIETTTAKVTTLESANIDASNISAVCIDTNSIDAEDAVIENACIGKLSTSCFSSDEIATSKINSTSLSVPKLETSGGITGKGTIDVTSSVWKEIRIPLFTGTIQFYTDEWKVTVTGGREFIWEDESLDHLKFISNDGETVTIAVDWDGEVYYTYNVAKNEPIISLVDNTGHIQANDYTYIMQDSGIPRGTVYIYQDKEFTNQGLTILGKVKASNLEITCGESIDCLSVGNLCVGNSIISDSPIDFNICARSFCVSSPCTYIDNCLYADHLETHCICNDGYLWTDRLYFDTIQMVHCTEKPKSVVVYENGLLCDSYKVCVDDDTVYSQKSCACDFYGNLHGKANDTCCFDGRLFCDACLEILSGKACTAELADMAKKVCIGKCWAGTEPDWGYIPFADAYNGCIFQARMDTGYGNPLVAYNEYGLLCLEIRGCVCVPDDPLIARSIATRYLKADDMRVCSDALITRLCSCEEYTKRLDVSQCAKFHGPTYFYGNIYQCGASYCTHAQNIYTCSDTITMREGADFAGDAQIKVLKYDGTNNGVIQLGTDGTLRIGDETNCQPVLTRSEEDAITDGHVLVWDATARCAKDGGDAIVTCEYVHCVGKECAKASCDYACIVAKCCDYCNRSYTDQMDKICCACLGKNVCEACINSYNHADTVGTCCFQKACCCAIDMDKMCLACAYSCSDVTLSCAYKCSKYDALCACAYAVSCANDVRGAACTYAHSVGYECKNAACSFAVSCGHSIGTACKNAATSTKANCYGKSYNCVQCSEWARRVCLEAFDAATKKFIYIGMPDTEKNIGCNPNLWYCPTCNIMAMGSADGGALCLVGAGSCCMSGICTKLNPKVVFASTDKQCGCLQYSQYDGVHSGAGLCWQTNTANSWFQTDCFYANKYLDKNGCQLGAYCATIPRPIGTTGYVLLDLGSAETSVQFNTLNNSGTITRVEATSILGHVIALNGSGITGWDSIEAPSHCFWLRVKAPVKLWGRYPINVVSNTNTDPGCTWNSPTILPTCSYVSTVGCQCKDAACTYASSVGGQCKNDACAFAVSCGHAIGTACKNAATAKKANCYGNSNNCVQCSELARQVILGAYNAPQKRFVYFGNPADATPIGCNPNLWYCPTCSILAMTGSDKTGSTLCLVGKGSCCMSGKCSKENPKIVFSDTAGYCGCLQLSRYTDTVHPGYGLCWMTNYPQDSWIQTDCFYAKCYLDSNGNCLAGYTATVASPAGNTRYVLLDLGKEDTMVDFQVYNSHGTIVKSTGDGAPAGAIYQSNSYGINGYCMVDAVGSCVWLRLVGWRALNLWGSYPIKVVANTTTNPGCTWNSPTIFSNCTYVSTVGTQCKSAACSFTASCGHEIGTACKDAATATKANCYGNSYSCVACSDLTRKVDLETYNALGQRPIYFGRPDACKNVGCNPNLWFCPTCNIMTMGDANGSAMCLIGTGTCCMSGACTKLNPKIVFSSTDKQCGCLQFSQYDGVHPGAGLCWATNQASAWFQTDCIYANKYLDKNGVALPTCSYANTVAFCNVDTCKGIGVMGVARGVDAQCWTKAGYWAYMTMKDGPDCCFWNHVMKMDWTGSKGVDYWSSGISIPTMDSPSYGIHYKVGCCGGTTGWTLVPNIACVQRLGCSCQSLAEACACAFTACCGHSIGKSCKNAACAFAVSCGHEIGTSCRNAACSFTSSCGHLIGTSCKNDACAFAAACAQSVVPETSTFAKCYGKATNCVAYANQVRVGVASGNTYYKMPFTGSTGTTTSNQSLYIDNANAFPSYNPSTNVFCGYTVCVAQTLAVRNANGGFRLGNYCIYIA